MRQDRQKLLRSQTLGVLQLTHGRSRIVMDRIPGILLVKLIRLGSSILLLLGASGLLLAQSTGAIQGTVADPTGAVLPNATVAVMNQATGETHVLKTDSAGLYSLPGLAPGNYKIEVRSQGMQTVVASDLVVAVGMTTTQN